MISLKEQEHYVKSKGWSTWYHSNYWVHTKTIVDPNCQDYTSYGLSLNSAYCFEKLNLPPFRPGPFPSVNQQIQALENKDKILEFFKTLEKTI